MLSKALIPIYHKPYSMMEPRLGLGEIVGNDGQDDAQPQ